MRTRVRGYFNGLSPQALETIARGAARTPETLLRFLDRTERYSSGEQPVARACIGASSGLDPSAHTCADAARVLAVEIMRERRRGWRAERRGDKWVAR